MSPRCTASGFRMMSVVSMLVSSGPGWAGCGVHGDAAAGAIVGGPGRKNNGPGAVPGP